MLEKSVHAREVTSKMSVAQEYWNFNFLTHCEIPMLTKKIEAYFSKETLYS